MLQQAVLRDPGIDTNNAQRLFSALRGTAAGENPAMMRLQGNMLKHAQRGSQLNFKSFTHYGMQLMAKKLYGPDSNLYKKALMMHATEPGIAGAKVDELISGKSGVKWDLGLMLSVMHSLFEDQRRFFKSKPVTETEDWSSIIAILDADEQKLLQCVARYAVLLKPDALQSWFETMWVNSGFAVQKRVSDLFAEQIDRTLSQSDNLVEATGNVTGYCITFNLGGKCVAFKCKKKHVCFECEQPHRFVNCARYPKVVVERKSSSNRSDGGKASGNRHRNSYRGSGNGRGDHDDRKPPGNFDHYNKRRGRD